MNHKAGDKVFVDYTGEKLDVIDLASGELKAVEVFVAIFGASPAHERYIRHNQTKSIH